MHFMSVYDQKIKMHILNLQHVFIQARSKLADLITGDMGSIPTLTTLFGGVFTPPTFSIFLFNKKREKIFLQQTAYLN